MTRCALHRVYVWRWHRRWRCHQTTSCCQHVDAAMCNLFSPDPGGV